MSTETTIVEPTEVIGKATKFNPGNLMLLGLIGMVGALTLLLFQAIHEREELRKAYLTVPPTVPAASPNGKYDGPVTTSTEDAGTSTAEV